MNNRIANHVSWLKCEDSHALSLEHSVSLHTLRNKEHSRMANTLYDNSVKEDGFNPFLDWLASNQKTENDPEIVRIYFIQSESGEIKIGYSCNVSSRLRSLQSSNHKKLHILRIISGTKNLEIALHTKFSKYKIQGEWFYPAKEILDFIEPRFLIIPEVGTHFSDLRETPSDKKNRQTSNP